MAKKIGKMIYPQQGTQSEQVMEALKLLGLETAASSCSFVAQKTQDAHETNMDFIEQLLRLELAGKEEARVNRWINQAKLGPVKTIAEFDFGFQPLVDPVLIHELASCRFIEKGRSVVFLGPPGVGKTHLATALAYEAIQKGFEVRVVRANEFLHAVDRSAHNSLKNLQAALQKPKLLILDDIDYYRHDEESCQFFFDVLKQRYEFSRSTIITSNRDPMQWDNIFGKRGVGALIDRLFDHQRTTMVNISGGRSYRVPQPLALTHASKRTTPAPKDDRLFKKIATAFSHGSQQ